MARLEAHIGDGFALPRTLSVVEARRKAGLAPGDGGVDGAAAGERQSKLAAFWDAMKERASWRLVYADGLH